MKAMKLLLITMIAIGLAATGCSSKKGTTTVAEYEQQLKQKDSELNELESSVETLESELARQKSEAQAKAQAAERAEKMAREAEDRARSAEMAAKKSSATTTTSAPARGIVGSELLPPNAKPGECYARVFVPPTYGTETERVLNREASERLEVVPAKYEWVTEKVLVKAASTRLEKVPAKYEWREEKVLVKEAHTVWKKGRGPVEKVDNSTGEIMCLVEVPASYKTVKQKVMVSGPTTRTVEIPAEYKTVKVQKLVTSAKEKRISIPAEYTTVTKTQQLTDGRMEWREVLCETNMSHTTVSELQRALKSAGHDPGPIDGLYGPLTRAGVRSYQKAKGLPTGGLTMATINKLGVRI